MQETATNGPAAEPEKVPLRQEPPAEPGDEGSRDEGDRPAAEADYAAVDAYLAAMEGPAATDEPPEAMEQRLSRLKTAVHNRGQRREEDWNQLINELTLYAFQVVRSWLAIVADDDAEWTEAERSRLIGADVDELAISVVSRAENGFRRELSRIRWWLDGTEPDMKTLHLVECAIQLPAAYRDWELRHYGGPAEDPLEAMATGHHDGQGGAWPLGRVYQRFTQEREDVLHKLQRTLPYNEQEAWEIIEGTLSALDLLARRGGSR